MTFERLPFMFWRAPSPGLTVLIYHRVLPTADPLRPGEVVAEQFERQMKMLRRCFQPVALADAARRLRDGSLVGRPACVTFDDGYADNLTVAQPILERLGIPATVFVATGYLDGGRMFNDAVIDGVAAMRADTLDLRDMGIGTLSLAGIDARRRAVQAILNTVKRLPGAERDARVRDILRAGRVDRLPAPPMLTSDQVRRLAGAGVEIGGHTVSHSILASMTDAQAEAEIQEGRRTLEGLIDRSVRQFAYPNGRPARDYGAQHPAMIARLGFDLAVSTAAGAATVRSYSPFEIPRVPVWGRSMLRSAARLARNLRTPAFATA